MEQVRLRLRLRTIVGRDCPHPLIPQKHTYRLTLGLGAIRLREQYELLTFSQPLFWRTAAIAFASDRLDSDLPRSQKVNKGDGGEPR